ncbi:chlorophyll a synthase [Gracilaria domingensis]|nr:chlorophyll a synthase [Gracilaria domingensis]
MIAFATRNVVAPRMAFVQPAALARPRALRHRARAAPRRWRAAPRARRRVAAAACAGDAPQAPPPPPPPSPDVDAAGTPAGPSSPGDVRQLLGIRGADTTTSKWRIRLQLMKPVTWVPLLWGVTCGAAASGNYTWTPEHVAQALACMVLAGPLLTGYTQTLNDWCDREIDAINEPQRPIPSGAISEKEVKTQLVALLLAGIALSVGIDVWTAHEWPINTALTLFGSFIAYIYSEPPLKLKQNGWLGCYALGASYISLPWWCGHAAFGQLDWKVMLLTLFYSFSGLGIAIVNDFKSVEGDRATGMQSLPVMFGIDTAKWICAGMIDVFQLLVAAVVFSIGEQKYAAGILALVIPQIVLQFQYLLKDPVKYDVKYQAAAQPFLVIGILVTALAVGHHGPLI